MREPFTQLYLHAVWATWDRAPLLTPTVMTAVDRVIRSECVAMRVEVLAIGGMPDHLHLLVRLSTTVSIAQLVKQVKGASSHMVQQRLRESFKWQGGYGAFTVSRSHVARVEAYVRNQARHHTADRLHPALELPR